MQPGFNIDIQLSSVYGSMVTSDSYTEDYHCYISLIEQGHPSWKFVLESHRLEAPSCVSVRASLGARPSKTFLGSTSTVPDLCKANSTGARGTRFQW